MATAAYIRNFLSAKLLFHGVLLVNDCLIPECSCRAIGVFNSRSLCAECADSVHRTIL